MPYEIDPHLDPFVSRGAVADDLAALNPVIEAAVWGWRLADRVKRLVLPSYLYREPDLKHLEIRVIDGAPSGIVALAAWEPASPQDLPPGAASGLLLHGLYVHPEYTHRGLGTRLLREAQCATRERALDGLLVKAQADAGPFFRHCGMVELPALDPERDFPNRFWWDCRGPIK